MSRYCPNRTSDNQVRFEEPLQPRGELRPIPRSNEFSVARSDDVQVGGLLFHECDEPEENPSEETVTPLSDESLQLLVAPIQTNVITPI